jgi:hypothetical protein
MGVDGKGMSGGGCPCEVGDKMVSGTHLRFFLTALQLIRPELAVYIIQNASPVTSSVVGPVSEKAEFEVTDQTMCDPIATRPMITAARTRASIRIMRVSVHVLTLEPDYVPGRSGTRGCR